MSAPAPAQRRVHPCARRVTGGSVFEVEVRELELIGRAARVASREARGVAS
jgi:hypothetical protein